MIKQKQDSLILEAINDFDRFLIEYGLPKELVKALVENEADQAPMPPGFDKIRLQPSQLQGDGLFALTTINSGELLAPARISGKRTPAGRYTNHSPRPNAYFQPLTNGDINMIAKKQINTGEEVTVDYRQAGSVNGVGLRCNRQEMIETLRLRFTHHAPNITVELGQFLDDALQSVGYLPSIPEMLDRLHVNKS